eukprot:IDg15009t1
MKALVLTKNHEMHTMDDNTSISYKEAEMNTGVKLKFLLPPAPMSIPELQGLGDSFRYKGVCLSAFRGGFRDTLLVKIVDVFDNEHGIMYPRRMCREIALHSGLKFQEPTYSSEEIQNHENRVHLL